MPHNKAVFHEPRGRFSGSRAPNFPQSSGPGSLPAAALASSVSARDPPGTRGQGRCGAARGAFPAAPPPGDSQRRAPLAFLERPERRARRSHAARQGADGAAVRGAAPAPLGRRQSAQTPGPAPELRRAARGAAGAAVRAAGGRHARRLPPHPAARAARPPPQRQLPRGGPAGRRQEVPAARQPAQRLALGLQNFV